MRKLLLWLHLGTGLVAGVFLLLLGVSGALLVFEDEIDAWLNPRLARVSTAGSTLPLGEIVNRLERADGGARVLSLILPRHERGTLRVTLRSQQPAGVRNLAVDPHTGEVLGSFDTANPFTRQLHQFHKNLLLADVGKAVTGWSAILLLALAVTGLVLWWPWKLWKFRPAGPPPTFQLHNVIGFYSSVFMALFAITGAVIHWDEEAVGWVNRLAGVPTPAKPANAAPPARGGMIVTADHAADLAKAAAPGAEVTGVQGLGSAAGAIRVTLRYPEDHTPLGRTIIQIDPGTGKILFAQLSRTASPGVRWVKLWNRQIHTGDLWGWPTRIVACLASLCLSLLVITGPLIWWSRLRRKRVYSVYASPPPSLD